jgi:hypothetical protein
MFRFSKNYFKDLNYISKSVFQTDILISNIYLRHFFPCCVPFACCTCPVIVPYVPSLLIFSSAFYRTSTFSLLSVFCNICIWSWEACILWAASLCVRGRGNVSLCRVHIEWSSIKLILYELRHVPWWCCNSFLIVLYSSFSRGYTCRNDVQTE